MIKYSLDALEYIRKIADGGMRDAITLLDKCIAYSEDVTLENVIKALGTTDYDTMFELTDAILHKKSDVCIRIIETIHLDGKDLKTFIRTYLDFILDVCKYYKIHNFNYMQIPRTYEKRFSKYSADDFEYCNDILTDIIKLNSDIKWDTNPKTMIEAKLLLLCV